MMASAMPISPARTPFRAVRGWLNHLSERIKRAAAIRYVALPSQSFAKSFSAAVVCASSKTRDAKLITAGRLPSEHFQHPVGDPEAADDVRRGGNNAKDAQHVGEPCLAFRHHLNTRDDGDSGN